MSEQRLFPKPIADRVTTPFSSAMQAWFWFVRCQASRIEGARVVADACDVVRPCDPDDIYNAVMRLRRENVLDDRHLQVIEYYGLVERTPDPRDGREKPKYDLWCDAMAALQDALIARDIVLPGAEDAFHHPERMIKMTGELPPCRL